MPSGGFGSTHESFIPSDLFDLFLWSARSGDQTSMCRLRGIPDRGRLSVGQPTGLETLPMSCSKAHVVPNSARPGGKIVLVKGAMSLFSLGQATSCGASTSKGVPRLSTASRYSTSLRATARVARLRLPRVSSFSCSAANCGFQFGASLAASISVVCKYLLRFLEMGPRCSFPADSR